MQKPTKAFRAYALILSIFTAGQNAFGQADLGTEFTADMGLWGPWAGATANLTDRPGFIRLTVPGGALGGLQLTGGVPVTNYPPPWHFEVALERPTDVNTAIGIIIQSDGLQSLFHSLNNGDKTGFAIAAGFGSSGKTFGAGADFSGVPAEKMAGKRLIIYMGMVDDTHMRWGVRPDEASEWAFAPDVDIGFSASASPVSFSDLKLMIENRDGWFNYVGGGSTKGAPNGVSVDVDYVRFVRKLDPIDLGTEFTTGMGPWDMARWTLFADATWTNAT
jgi:hypothetical protein